MSINLLKNSYFKDSPILTPTQTGDMFELTVFPLPIFWGPDWKAQTKKLNFLQKKLLKILSTTYNLNSHINTTITVLDGWKLKCTKKVSRKFQQSTTYLLYCCPAWMLHQNWKLCRRLTMASLMPQAATTLCYCLDCCCTNFVSRKSTYCQQIQLAMASGLQRMAKVTEKSVKNSWISK